MYTAKTTIRIHAPIAKVWEALITPEIIKEYLFGTEAVSDWKEGSTIVYKGKWEGKEYEDHGVIKEIEPEAKLVTSYWSAAFGPDVPENYKTVSYFLSQEEDDTLLTVSQDNNATEEAQLQSQSNWSMVLETLKKVLEHSTHA